MRWISYENQNSKARRFMTTDSLLLGGLETREGQVSLFAPKIPPLHIPCADPALVATNIMNFMSGAIGIEHVTSTGGMQVLNLNALISETT